ncbi:hypothetical protein ACQP3D_27550, partial [Escherichia coli]
MLNKKQVTSVHEASGDERGREAVSSCGKMKAYCYPNKQTDYHTWVALFNSPSSVGMKEKE